MVKMNGPAQLQLRSDRLQSFIPETIKRKIDQRSLGSCGLQPAAVGAPMQEMQHLSSNALRSRGVGRDKIQEEEEYFFANHAEEEEEEDLSRVPLSVSWKLRSPFFSRRPSKARKGNASSISFILILSLAGVINCDGIL